MFLVSICFVSVGPALFHVTFFFLLFFFAAAFFSSQILYFPCYSSDGRSELLLPLAVVWYIFIPFVPFPILFFLFFCYSTLALLISAFAIAMSKQTIFSLSVLPFIYNFPFFFIFARLLHEIYSKKCE